MPPRSFQYKYWFKIQNLDDFNFTELALVLLNPRGACKFCKTYTRSLYQGDKVKSLVTYIPESNPLEILDRKFNCKDSQLESVINLVNPCPFTNLVGLISKSYSNKYVIHFALSFPDQAE